jgi:hypothetical protein
LKYNGIQRDVYPIIKKNKKPKNITCLLNISWVMRRVQNETSWLKHQTLSEIQSTEVFVSEFNALCTFSHLLHEVK